MSVGRSPGFAGEEAPVKARHQHVRVCVRVSEELAEPPLKAAVHLAVEISGEPRNTLYQAALALKNQGDGAEPALAGPSRTMP